jgi:hypothetical protein
VECQQHQQHAKEKGKKRPLDASSICKQHNSIHTIAAPLVSPTCLLQDTTKNYAPQEAAEQLQQLLRLPWSSGSLQTLSATTNIQISTV